MFQSSGAGSLGTASGRPGSRVHSSERDRDSTIEGKDLRTTMRFIATTGASLLAVGLAFPAHAAGSDSDPLTAIAAAAPEVLTGVADVSVDVSGKSAVRATTPEGSAILPTEAADGVTLVDSTGVEITVGLPNAMNAENAVAEAEGIVSYDNNDGSTTVPVLKEDASVQITTVIAGASAPTRYEYPLRVPANATVNLDPANGAVQITDAVGNFLAGVAPAWAKDANGADIATHYELEGMTLTQVVEHAEGSAYPIVADPWLGIALVDRTKWSGNTLQVYPSSWARVNPLASAGVAARWAGWDEVLNKTPGNRENTPSMRDQYYCHFDFVRFRAPNKVSWNLDLGRPAYDYWTLIQRQCN